MAKGHSVGEYSTFNGCLEFFSSCKVLASHNTQCLQETARKIRATPGKRVERKDEVRDVSRLRKSMNNPDAKKRLDHWQHKKATPGRVLSIPRKNQSTCIKIRSMSKKTKHPGCKKWYKGRRGKEYVSWQR